MNSRIEFSIIVATYNATIGQLKRTFSSILGQKNTELEIIVCDDASEENHFAWIKEFFDGKGFGAYRLMASEENQGTVRNMLRGLREAEGKYAKLIGAGDLLYCATTLSDVRTFMEEEKIACCFGLMQGFYMKEGRPARVLRISPRDIMAYRHMDKQKIARNLLVSEDWVSGAAIFATTEYYIKYISMLEGKVLYCEDWASALALADGVYLRLYDRYVVWYEVGEGVSTTPNQAWRKKLEQDNESFWQIFDAYAAQLDNHAFDRQIHLRKRKKLAGRLGGKYMGTILKAVTNPSLLLFEAEARRQERAKVYAPRTAAYCFKSSAR